MGSNTVMINNANVSLRNLIDNYGRLTVADIKNHIMNYIGKQTKKEQQSIHMYHLILKSITESEQLNAVIESHKYTMQGTPVGEILLKI